MDPSNASSATLPRVTYSNVTQDFSAVHTRLDDAIAAFERGGLGGLVRNRVRAADLPGEDERSIASPIDARIVLARFHPASNAAVDAAVAAAHAAYPAWSALGWEARVGILEQVAQGIEARKWELAVAALLEVGKSRMEAMGEVEEAIDLVRYYCAEMRRNDGYRRSMQRAFAHEATEVVLRPHGVFAVIAPFNYPVALATSMLTGALLGGNTVVFKPSPGAALTASLLVDVFERAGLPEGAIGLVCGGASTGRALARQANVRGIVFTGSHAVGMELLRERALGPHAIPVIAEMGGKNPAYVCESANLDDAVEGVARSAYGLSGQKCSCESRVLVHAARYDEFVERLALRARQMPLGDPRERATFIGPVIDAAAHARYERAVDEAGRDGALRLGGGRLRGGAHDHGFYLQPVIATDLPYDHRLHREELFLPFLTVQRFTTLDDALAQGNAVNYGLTAGIYTSDSRELAEFLERAEAGVLYANRASGATTGAWPGIQSFCGWKGSGTTSKGGLGPFYLPQFMREQSRTVIAPGQRQA
ncbi:MAG: aldehyde dehydrogenase family protein [Rudaea sp.]